ncbi:response regulator [Flavisolibacter nicotianae]|uniref:response regulator n=1 Tax=Flavisolibacter nicotianae TaxID=2364882 RepID=UPI000EB3D2A4|nr:response regulator [Flavisolibacter nicotianae]
MKRKHQILIVDDDADDREIIRDAFMSSVDEQEYVFIENGDKLLEYLENATNGDTPSLIMLDLNMPGKDGRETLKELKMNGRFQHIPTIVFTTSSSQRDKQMVYELGANCFITKPDTFNKLIEMTNSITKLWLQ